MLIPLAASIKRFMAGISTEPSLLRAPITTPFTPRDLHIPMDSTICWISDSSYTKSPPLGLTSTLTGIATLERTCSRFFLEGVTPPQGRSSQSSILPAPPACASIASPASVQQHSRNLLTDPIPSSSRRSSGLQMSAMRKWIGTPFQCAVRDETIAGMSFSFLI